MQAEMQMDYTPDEKTRETTIKKGATSTKVRVSYGLGDTACNIVFGMITALLTLFYTDYAGVPVATVGLVMLISRVFDGSSDVIMGFLVNKTHSKWGKARPWILWMSVPYCVSAVALFLVPQTNASLQFWYIFIVYNLCTTVCYTAINVPLGTLSTRMTRVSHERDMLSVFRMALAPVGKIIAVTFTLPVVKLFGNDKSAWAKTMSIWVVLAFLMLLICFLNCKETEEEKNENRQKEKGTAGKDVKALLSNQYFWSCLILWTVTCVHATIIGTVLPYYCKYEFGNDNLYSYVYTAEIVVLIIGAILSPALMKKMGKRNLSLAGAIVAVLAQAAFLFNPGSFSWAMVTTVIRAFGQAPLTAVVFGMMGDTVDFGEWKSNRRTESLIFGGGSLGFKIGTGITSAVMTSLLAAAGYMSSTAGGAVQPDSAITMIRNIYIWGPMLVWGVAVITLVLYQLDKKYPRIMKDLEERRSI
ncbi:MAG: glycoside-pentoside-hexuronide (GPH):cation symporter [Lachnospiraceae bacterium]|nr:glycoside-pentoside-hexuronide (GPH):cation symporter [Lachnospiraceae bacterium]